MTAYFVGESDITGLDNYRIHLERLPEHLDNFLKGLGLPSVGASNNQAMIDVLARAKRDGQLWPEASKGLRTFHDAATLFIDEARELVTQLNLYKEPEGTDSIRDNLNTLALHAAPFNLNGKLGISPTSKTYDVTSVLTNKLIHFDSVLYNFTNDITLIKNSTTDIIPRTTDFMRGKILDHDVKHRRADSTFPESVKEQLEIANSSLDSSNKDYLRALQAANNMDVYCTRLRQILNDAKSVLLGITPMSNARWFLNKMNMMNTHLTEAQNFVSRVQALM